MEVGTKVTVNDGRDSSTGDMIVHEGVIREWKEQTALVETSAGDVIERFHYKIERAEDTGDGEVETPAAAAEAPHRRRRGGR